MDIDWEYFVFVIEVVDFVLLLKECREVLDEYFVKYVKGYYMFIIIVCLVGLMYYG